MTRCAASSCRHSSAGIPTPQVGFIAYDDPGMARTLFERASATSNDLGLFAEQFDVGSGSLLGNFPQGQTHLSHISPALALRGRMGSGGRWGADSRGIGAQGERQMDSGHSTRTRS